ncbi:hypoxanthine phosphoribosyltransferase [Candidatus Sumerlaeota bacterium]|nr:hypoxanthine phosphoribosyltransferase [Candidatus Sumerlaeota bacterium]
MPLHPDFEEILFSREIVEQRVHELGAAITKDYAGRNLLLVGILRGAMLFMADLARAIDLPLEMDMIEAKSYNGTESTGQVRITKDVETSLAGRDVLLVEDIYDTGRTLREIVALMRVRNPNSVEVCCLLEKPDRRVIEVPVKYTGFTIADKFVVGYGLDYNERYRNIQDIGVLKKEIYSE